MTNDTVQITLNRTQVEILRSLLKDAANENSRLGYGETYPFSKPWYEKRAITCRHLVRYLSKAKDRRRKYIDLSAEQFPISV